MWFKTTVTVKHRSWRKKRLRKRHSGQDKSQFLPVTRHIFPFIYESHTPQVTTPFPNLSLTVNSPPLRDTMSKSTKASLITDCVCKLVYNVKLAIITGLYRRMHVWAKAWPFMKQSNKNWWSRKWTFEHYTETLWLATCILREKHRHGRGQHKKYRLAFKKRRLSFGLHQTLLGQIQSLEASQNSKSQLVCV